MNEKPPQTGDADADEYSIAPLPETFQSATSPAYRAEPAKPDPGSYAVGPEVDDARYSIGAENWQEASAGVKRNVDEFGLAPTVPQFESSVTRSTLRRLADREAAEQAARPTATVEDPTRFTLTNLFLLITLASVVFALGKFVPRGIFAGICGAAALLSLAMARFLGRNGAVFQLAWWMLFGIYLLVSILASLDV